MPVRVKAAPQGRDQSPPAKSSGHPVVRRISSITQLAKALGLRRSGASEDQSGGFRSSTASETGNASELASNASVRPLQSSLSSANRAPNGLPRSSTYSNLPRPMSNRQVNPKTNLPTSHTSTNLIGTSSFNPPSSYTGPSNRDKALPSRPSSRFVSTSQAYERAKKDRRRSVIPQHDAQYANYQQYEPLRRTTAHDFQRIPVMATGPAPSGLKAHEYGVLNQSPYLDERPLSQRSVRSVNELEQKVDAMRKLLLENLRPSVNDADSSVAEGELVSQSLSLNSNHSQDSLQPSAAQEQGALGSGHPEHDESQERLVADVEPLRVSEAKKAVPYSLAKPVSPFHAITGFGHQLYERSHDPHAVYRAKTSAYWSGRFISLNDKLMNEKADIPLPGNLAMDKVRIALGEFKRHRQIFEMLEECCRSNAAAESLEAFKIHFAAIHQTPGLCAESKSHQRQQGALRFKDGAGAPHQAPVGKRVGRFRTRLTMTSTPPAEPLGTPKSNNTEWSEGSSQGATPRQLRKISVVDRLVGRGRKKSDMQDT